MSTVLPRVTKEQRELKREIAIISGTDQNSYLELIDDLFELYSLYQKELACTLPKQSSNWSKLAIVKFIHIVPSKKISKDARVHYLSKVLDIGTINTLEICRVTFLPIK
jgi:hypothetical protein